MYSLQLITSELLMLGNTYGCFNMKAKKLWGAQGIANGL